MASWGYFRASVGIFLVVVRVVVLREVLFFLDWFHWVVYSDVVEAFK